jgi:hypothetical protein
LQLRINLGGKRRNKLQIGELLLGRNWGDGGLLGDGVLARQTKNCQDVFCKGKGMEVPMLKEKWEIIAKLEALVRWLYKNDYIPPEGLGPLPAKTQLFNIEDTLELFKAQVQR